MESFKKLYFQRMKEIVKPYGFKLSKDSFVRVINDVSQGFTLDIINQSKEYADYYLHFGISPLCQKSCGTDFIFGAYYELTPGKQFGDKNRIIDIVRPSEESINNWFSRSTMIIAGFDRTSEESIQLLIN